MIINNVTFNADVQEVIFALKQELSEKDIHYFAKSFDSGKDYMVCCPYHKDGRERRPSAGIRKSDGMFHCFACGKTASLPEMVTDCLSVDGYKWLTSHFLSLKADDREIELDLDRTHKREEAKYISDVEYDKYRYTHPYMYDRGLTDSVIEDFDLGYDDKTGSIVFPVKNLDGNIMFLARRSVKNKRFDLPKNIDKPLYGLYELSRVIYSGTRVSKAPTVYVCEGLFDCLRLWCNSKCAVAGFGCNFSTHQIEQLRSLPSRVMVLAFDNDKAGQEAMNKLKDQLPNKLLYKVILPENRKDIGECTDEEIQNLEVVLV